MKSNSIQKIVDNFLSGDQQLARSQILELKSELDYFEQIAPFFSPKTEDLFVSTLEDSIKLFLESNDCKASIVRDQDCSQIEEAISHVFTPFKNTVFSLQTKDQSYDESSLSIEFFLIRKLFNKKIHVGILKNELDFLSDSGVDSIDVQLVSAGEHFEIVEKREIKANIESSFELFKQSMMLFAIKNITPRTVTIGTIAISLAMNLMGSSSQAHADVTHVHNLVDSDTMDNVLQKISDNISSLDHSHSNIVKVLENHVQGTHNGVGHFKIQVGDCYVAGDYGVVKTAMSENQHVNISSGFFKHPGITEAPAVCKDWAIFLEKILRDKVSQSLER